MAAPKYGNPGVWGTAGRPKPPVYRPPKLPTYNTKILGDPGLESGSVPVTYYDNVQYPYGAPGVPADRTAGNPFYTPPTERRGHMVTPDFSGILGSYTADRRNRFGAGLQDMKARRMSLTKSAVNKLGTRDVAQMVQTLMKYGMSQADAQTTAEGALNNPWSELKALDFQKRNQWNQGVAQLAGQGLYRSGATVDRREQIDTAAARNEALLTQNTEAELGEHLFAEKDWERQQRDEMERDIASQQAALAAAYQPYWVED